MRHWARTGASRHLAIGLVLPALALLAGWRSPGEQLPADLRPLLDFSDPDGTEERLRALLPAAREAGDPDYLAEVLTQLARTDSRRGRFESAHRQLDEVEPMLSAATPRATIRYLLERGRTFSLADRREPAAELFRQAFALAEREGPDYLAIDAAHMIAFVAPEYTEQVAWTEKALAIAAASPDPETRQWMGSLTTNLGWTHFDHEDYTPALALFERALAWREANGAEPAARLAARWNVGRALRALGRDADALALQESLLADYRRLDLPVYGYVYEELAELYFAAGDPRAREYFGLAYEALADDVWMVNSQAERLARLAEMAGEDPHR